MQTLKVNRYIVIRYVGEGRYGVSLELIGTGYFSAKTIDYFSVESLQSENKAIIERARLRLVKHVLRQNKIEFTDIEFV